ncbi:MAG: hypothetical protein H6Q69_220 [Firmicutes bacterium]|nr:hypothetical protein [Bacillota bacterium]
MIKTYANWEGDLGAYLQIGDEVDQEMVDYFINVLPPACMNGECVQIGEPYSHRYDENGKWEATYPTLKSNRKFGAKKMAEYIPFGQPILIGHHSEQRDRNFVVNLFFQVNHRTRLERYLKIIHLNGRQAVVHGLEC